MNELEKLDSIEEIRKVDPEGLIGVLASLPEELAKASEISAQTKLSLPKKVRAVYILGMGGSGVAGLLLKSALADSLSLPVELIKTYSPPESLTKNDLLIAVSYSGNTGEILNTVKIAERKKIPMVFVSSGGKLAQLASQKKISCIEIPGGYQPRAAAGLLLVPLLYIFEKLGEASSLNNNLEEAITILKTMQAELDPSVPFRQNEAKKMAGRIINTFPLIYGTAFTYPAAYRFKCQLNENAKMLAHAGEMPEVNHNEIEGLYDLKRGAHNFSVTFLRCDKDDERVKRQVEITKSLVGAQVGGVIEVFSRGKSKLAQILSLVYLGDMASAYTAVLRGTHPSSIKAIQKLKKELSR
ncbi:MAG: bifunctional phosphoglucose/phosphomannose isomerase [Candidatus Margulisbacteria bacterium]|nr:bifunctional phosphoglucose/phosphomannose isomerase [Candidatus Margulisiibacteriota bacterium]MBU1021941.1 bifunctional phosphoglucose/phosphomannose isomerase [Candidatus Margulisiibacteriota bacterium]MBU1728920.1 bifunctional phosphoglucose/phosphomannose isomerase [Candidatus Margulisiibacteriota bacterium]MBU1954726.1 bifunctional phosphoglucose/phosphomannose isomerase [Candidatus Margulisiibacteriota bacterium]